jgi:NADH-quinone oxidoreductase subunit N
LLRSGPHSMGLVWLILLAIGLSAVSLYYYLQVLKQVFVAPVPSESTRFTTPPIQMVLVILLALAVIAMGCWPEWLVGKLTGAAALAGL